MNAIQTHPQRKAPVSAQRMISIKRCHGLGNVICLLPVLRQLHNAGRQVTIQTQPQWLSAFSQLFPEYLWIADTGPGVTDLDNCTEDQPPVEHRTDELARLLNLTGPFGPPRINVPPSWEKPFRHLRNTLIVAPEAGHPSRQWPTHLINQLKFTLAPQPIVLIGTGNHSAINSDFDLRGQLDLQQLLGLLAVAGAVITMDSGVLHLAAALARPTVAIFGGIDYRYRIHPAQNVVAIQSDLPCCPCNKNEICHDRFDCIKSPTPHDVAAALDLARLAPGRINYSVHTHQNKMEPAGRAMPATSKKQGHPVGRAMPAVSL